MNEKELQNFLPEDVVFQASKLDGKRGIFQIWYKIAQDGMLQTMKFIRKNGHWHFQSDFSLRVGH